MNRRIGTFINKILYYSITNNIAAEKVINLLATSKNDCIIFPFNDYPGPLSKKILTRDFRSLTVCDSDENRRGLFESYVKKEHPDRRVNIQPHNLIDLSFQYYNHNAQETCSDVVRESIITVNNENARVKFLVPLLSSKFETAFFTNLYYQMTLKLGLCSHMRIQYYFLVSDRQYRYLVARPSENLKNYRASSILYNTIFKINELDSFDLEVCFGISLKKLQKTSDSNSECYKMVHLLWLEPKIDLIEQLGPRTLLEFRFLVSQMMQKRSVSVLHYLDKWFGSCTNDLGSLGITEKTRTGDLTVEQFLDLHLYLRSRDEYAKSTFLQAASSIEDYLNMNMDQDSLGGPIAS